MIEVKSLDVENAAEEFYINLSHLFGWRLKSSQRIFNRNSNPRAAFSYENYTYIYSETEEVDYTKLVFERDTNMPFYRRIKELENEFFELMENRTGNRPVEPGPLKSFTEWKEKHKPSPLSAIKKFVLTVVFSIVFGFLGATIAQIDGYEIVLVILLMCLPCYGIVALLNMFLLKRATEDSTIGQSLKPEYESYKKWHAEQLERIQYYDYVTERIPQLFEELQLLVD